MSTFLGLTIILVINALFQEGIYGLQCAANDDCVGLKNRNKLCCQSNVCQICPPCNGNTDCGPLEYCCRNTSHERANYTSRYCRSSCIGAFCESYDDCGDYCCRSNKCVNCSQTFCRSHSECQSGQYCCSNGQCKENCTGLFCYSSDDCSSQSECCKSFKCVQCHPCVNHAELDSNDSSKSSGFPTATFFSVVVTFIVIAFILFICYKKQKKRAIPPALGQEFVYETANIERAQNNIPPALACGMPASQELILYPPLSHSIQGTLDPRLSPPSYSLHDPLASSDVELHLGTVDNPNTPPPPYVINAQTVSSEPYYNNDLPPSYEN